MFDEAEMRQAVEIGERNQEVIELVRRHCSHAVVTKPPFGGSGLLEAHTGLPIDMRTVRCQYAAHHAPAGMQLEAIALTFWESNCRGCPYRDVRDIPNLATLGLERLAERERQLEREQRAREAREDQRSGRAATRHARIAGESPSVRAFVDLLDGVDSEEPDARADQLVDQARAAPEQCSPLAGQILVDCSREVFDDRLLQALDHLERAGQIPPTPVLDSALLTLTQGPSRSSAAHWAAGTAGDRYGLLAHDEAGVLVGHAVYVKLEETRAEVAVEVADRLHDQGPGTILLERLASAAEQHGIRQFVAEVLGDNHLTLDVFRDGFDAHVALRDEVEMVEFPTAAWRAARERFESSHED